MNVSSFVLEQALKQLGISAAAIRQLQLAGQLSDINGNGFPTELFQLSAPMVTRGLLNYAVIQMKRDWLYPHWVYKQLDPKNPGFVARSQNPILLNITHRNWTMIGSPNGYNEAIIDPCGLLTPLPHEWSIDIWLITDHSAFFPSLSVPTIQELDTCAPKITTTFNTNGIILKTEAFVDSLNLGRDILFQAIHVSNQTEKALNLSICIAIRPFNPEGIAPIQSIEFKHGRQLYIDNCLGIVLAEEPQRVYCSNAGDGDTANIFRSQNKYINSKISKEEYLKNFTFCHLGLANAVIVYDINLLPEDKRSVCFSIALEEKRDLSNLLPKPIWRVSFDKRKEKHKERWLKERSNGACVVFSDNRIQRIFDANVLTLLQLHDGEFISPGPYLYHHFWFRDAAPMVYALDRLGYHDRSQQVIDGFPKRQTSDGFFRGPDGEWDSNGEVLWLIEQHAALSHSVSWIKHIYPNVQLGVEWIIQKRMQSLDSITTHRGLLPPSLSAEHFGTVDQYYWDSFWGLRGIRSAANLARITKHSENAEYWDHEAERFSEDIRHSLEIVANRLGKYLIPASPSRPFDETAIGFVAGIYPLSITDIFPEAFKSTLHEFTNRFVDNRGFYHPIIHSGYNPYLTLQLAHAYLFMNQPYHAWNIAETIFHQCSQSYSLPEAIHPKTGGGSMGDGHHGWAAAEVVLFLLDCIVREENNKLILFGSIQDSMLQWGINFRIQGIATIYGKVECTITYETQDKALCAFNLDQVSTCTPDLVEIIFPYPLKRILPVSSNLEVHIEQREKNTAVKFQSRNASLLLER